MKRSACFFAAMVWLALAGGMHSAGAAVIADSVAEYSGTQGLNSWYYGYYNQSADADGTYQTANFAQFDAYNANIWRRAVDGAGYYLSLNPLGGHPSGIGPAPQTQVIWSMRRYVSEVAGPINIAFDLYKENTQEPNGGGITGHIFLNGAEIFSQFIANLDGVGVHGLLNRMVNAGDVIDFAIDPTGVPGASGDNYQSARADGSVFSAVVGEGFAAVPSPSTMALLPLGLLLIGAVRGRARPAA